MWFAAGFETGNMRLCRANVARAHERLYLRRVTMLASLRSHRKDDPDESPLGRYLIHTSNVAQITVGDITDHCGGANEILAPPLEWIRDTVLRYTEEAREAGRQVMNSITDTIYASDVVTFIGRHMGDFGNTLAGRGLLADGLHAVLTAVGMVAAHHYVSAASQGLRAKGGDASDPCEAHPTRHTTAGHLVDRQLLHRRTGCNNGHGDSMGS